MRVKIEFGTDNAAFEDCFASEVSRVLMQAQHKVIMQSLRPKALCDTPEAMDKLLDINGNTIGTVKVTK